VTVGFVGLGHMGAPMAACIAAAGIEIVGFDAASDARENAPVPVVDGLAEIAARSDIVVLSLPGSHVVDIVVDELLAAPDSVLRLIVDTSSSDPARTRDVARRAAENDVSVVDAPVSGGVARAVDGTLTVMVGGAVEDVRAVRPVLEAIGNAVHLVGPVGAGHAVKALNNLLSAAHLITSCEALLTAQSYGVDPTSFVDVINTSSGRSGSTELKLPRYVIPRSFTSGFSAALLKKDALIAADLLREAGLADSLGVAVAEHWAHLTEGMDAGADHAAIIEPIEREVAG
jgi:3-hydroxyisobutyrate dehydrogenase